MFKNTVLVKGRYFLLARAMYQELSSIYHSRLQTKK